MKMIFLFFAAAFFNGGSWWALFAQDSQDGRFSWNELIQLGGTGGLVIALLGAVVTLWKERTQVKAELRSEIADLQAMLLAERTEHRAEIAAIQESYKADLQKISDRYTSELKNQIAALRAETAAELEAERKR